MALADLVDFIGNIWKHRNYERMLVMVMVMGMLSNALASTTSSSWRLSTMSIGYHVRMPIHQNALRICVRWIFCLLISAYLILLEQAQM